MPLSSAGASQSPLRPVSKSSSVPLPGGFALWSGALGGGGGGGLSC